MPTVSFEKDNFDDFIRMLKSGRKYFLERRNDLEEYSDWGFEVENIWDNKLRLKLDEVNFNYLSQGYKIYLSNKRLNSRGSSLRKKLFTYEVL